MSKTVLQPHLLRKIPEEFDVPVYDEWERRARECLLWRMSPEYYDSMTDIEYYAWISAWNQLQRESDKSA